MYSLKTSVVSFVVLVSVSSVLTVSAVAGTVSLKDIRTADSIIFLKQNKLYADYIPVTTPGASGLIPDVLDAKKNIKRQKEIEEYFSPIRNSLRNYSFERNFSHELNKELKKLNWFKNRQIKLLKIVDENRKQYSVLDITTENHDEIDGTYLAKTSADAILVVDPKYKIDAFFSEYVLDATVYLYAAGESHEVTYDEEEDYSGENFLYKNNLRFSYRLHGLSTKTQASKIWSDKRGPHYIQNIIQDSVKSVTRLIAYDLSLLASGRKQKKSGKTWSGSSLVFGDISGTIIGENKNKKIVRSKRGEIYSVVLTDQLSTAQSNRRKPSSNAKPVIYIYRSQELGSLFKTDISIDGKLQGTTGARTYIKKEVEPGEHTITVDAENQHSITIDAQPGLQYYISQEMRMGFFGFKAKLVPVDEIIGKSAVAESKQVK